MKEGNKARGKIRYLSANYIADGSAAAGEELFQNELRHLRRLPATRLSGDDDQLGHNAPGREGGRGEGQDRLAARETR